ncbi:hypothetical protein K7432_013832 [Basidiobolus ranarum]
MKRYNWNCKQKIQELMHQEIPNIYKVKLGRERINFRRIRPYMYLLVQAAFRLDIRSPLLESFSETLIALVQLTHIVPNDIEDKLKIWGLTELKSRQFVIHLWSILVEASYQVMGIPTCLETLEERVKARESEVLDYAYACTLALSFSKYHQDLQNLRDARNLNHKTRKKPIDQCNTKHQQVIERLTAFQDQDNVQV